jgi:hypothetical protein
MHRNRLPDDAEIIGRDFPRIAVTPGPDYRVYTANRGQGKNWHLMKGWPFPGDADDPMERRYSLTTRDRKRVERALWWILDYHTGRINHTHEGLRRRRPRTSLSLPAASIFDPTPDTEPETATMPAETDPKDATATATELDPTDDDGKIPVIRLRPDPDTGTWAPGSWFIAELALDPPFVKHYTSEAEAREKIRKLTLKDPARPRALCKVDDICFPELIQVTDVRWARPAPAAPAAPAPEAMSNPVIAPPAPEPPPAPTPTANGTGHDRLHMAMVPAGDCLDPDCTPRGIRSDLARRLDA